MNYRTTIKRVPGGLQLTQEEASGAWEETITVAEDDLRPWLHALCEVVKAPIGSEVVFPADVDVSVCRPRVGAFSGRYGSPC